MRMRRTTALTAALILLGTSAGASGFGELLAGTLREAASEMAGTLREAASEMARTAVEEALGGAGGGAADDPYEEDEPIDGDMDEFDDGDFEAGDEDFGGGEDESEWDEGEL